MFPKLIIGETRKIPVYKIFILRIIIPHFPNNLPSFLIFSSPKIKNRHQIVTALIEAG
jgi:hypothetical protein